MLLLLLVILYCVFHRMLARARFRLEMLMVLICRHGGVDQVTVASLSLTWLMMIRLLSMLGACLRCHRVVLQLRVARWCCEIKTLLMLT